MKTIITLQRNKCIGCAYCVEFSPNYFSMCKKDGKSILLKSIKKKQNHVLKTLMSNIDFDLNQKASNRCPVKIIKIKFV